MRAELAAWNDGRGITLEHWVGCKGNFSLAVGYSSLFWPEFVLFEEYILRKPFSEISLRGFANQDGATRASVERVMNHEHLHDLQHADCRDISPDKLIHLGTILTEIYSAKLRWQFPDRSCIVDFYRPDDPADFEQYQVTFYQKET
jgi:hypothetical protein